MKHLRCSPLAKHNTPTFFIDFRLANFIFLFNSIRFCFDFACLFFLENKTKIKAALSDLNDENVAHVLDCLEAHAPRVVLLSEQQEQDIQQEGGGGGSQQPQHSAVDGAGGGAGSGGGSRVQLEHKIDHKVYRLLEAAAQPEGLCQMKPTWMPWL